MDDETISIQFVWYSCKPDPIQFKPYSPEFSPVNIIVEVEIPKQYFKRYENGKTIISPRGMAYAIARLTKSIRNIQNGVENEDRNPTE